MGARRSVRVFVRKYSSAGERPCIYIPRDLETYLGWEPGETHIELIPLQDEDGFKVVKKDDEEEDDN